MKVNNYEKLTTCLELFGCGESMEGNFEGNLFLWIKKADKGGNAGEGTGTSADDMIKQLENVIELRKERPGKTQ